MKKLQASALMLACLLAAACREVPASEKALDDMEASKAAYKECLADHPQDLPACESRRLTYEADLKAYEATLSGTQSGR